MDMRILESNGGGIIKLPVDRYFSSHSVLLFLSFLFFFLLALVILVVE